MEAILDTNFIISCVKKKIHFIDELETLGFGVVLPREVVEELKDLRRSVSHNDRIAIDIALEQFTTNKIKKMKLGGRSVDEGLIAKGKQGAYIATLDAAIKRAVPYRITISAAQNTLQIERQ